MTPKERRAQMIRERGKTESTGINPNSPRARLEKQKTQTTKRSSITPKERRTQTISSRGDNFFTRKRTPLRTGKKAQQIARAQADVEKDLPRGTPSPQAMEDYKQTATAGKAAGKAAAAGVGTAAGKQTGKRAMAGLSEFGKAFAAARKAGKKDFTFRDKQYAAITKQEVQKAGASSLGDYLNKLKRSDSKIAKAPGQITKNKGGTITLTGEQKQTAKEKKKARRRAMKGMAKYNVGGKVTLEGKNISPEIRKKAEEFFKRQSGAAVTSDELKELQPKRFERDFDRPRAERLPMKPGMRLKPQTLPMRPGMERKARRLQEMSGAAVSENEMKSIMDQINKSPAEDKLATGGSVMARGCKMGRKKPTKLY